MARRDLTPKHNNESEYIMEKLKIWRTHPQIKLPKKQTTQSACFDLSFQGYGHNTYKGFSKSNKPINRVMNNQILLTPGDRVAVPTGLIMDIPKGYSVRVHARSGLSLKQGLVLANAEGVIDSDYVEEVMVLLHNVSDNNITIMNDDRIAQAELIKDAEYEIIESSIRPGVKTERIGGMGSTGISSVGEVITISIPEKQTTEKRGRGRPRKVV